MKPIQVGLLGIGTVGGDTVDTVYNLLFGWNMKKGFLGLGLLG